MKSARTFLPLLALVFCFNASAQQYAEAPFKVVAIEPTKALVEAVYLNNWMVANHARLSEGQTKGAREHLHALIDSQVKDLYLKNKVLLPPKSSYELASRYYWAGRLGVYGADSVYAAVKGDFPYDAPPGPKPPTGLSIQLKEQSLVVGSDLGQWQISVPFHFFVTHMQATVGRDSKPIEVVVISTGSAPDSAPPGYSQATLLVVFKAGAEPAGFEAEWAQNFQVPRDTKPTPIGDTQYQSRITYDPNMRLHKEIVSITNPKGGFVFIYSGLEGAYQANRPHFLDILRLLKIQ